MGNICTTYLDKQATLIFRFSFFFFLLKTISLKAQPGNFIVSLRAVFSFMCQNQHGFQADHSDLQRANSWGDPALVFTVFCKRPSPTESGVLCPRQRGLSWKCLKNCFNCPCYVCTLKVYGRIGWTEVWGFNFHQWTCGNHVDGDRRGTGRAWGRRVKYRGSFCRSSTCYRMQTWFCVVIYKKMLILPLIVHKCL